MWNRGLMKETFNDNEPVPFEGDEIDNSDYTDIHDHDNVMTIAQVVDGELVVSQINIEHNASVAMEIAEHE